MKKRTFTLAEIMEADDAQAGYCVECGAWRDTCEPDAREYDCSECGKNTVYGAAEIAIMGLVTDDEEARS